MNIAAKLTPVHCFSAFWRESETALVCLFYSTDSIQQKSSPGNFECSIFSLSFESLPALSLVHFTGCRKQVEGETGSTGREIERHMG